MWLKAILVGALLLASAVQAQQPWVARVKTLQGEASIVRGDVRAAARVGSEVWRGDLIETGADGSLGLTFRDGTLVSLGPSSSFEVQDFAFEPLQDELSLVARISRGTLLFVSGVIANLRPEAVALRTPTGTIGVRGTRFAVKVAGR